MLTLPYPLRSSILNYPSPSKPHATVYHCYTYPLPSYVLKHSGYGTVFRWITLGGVERARTRPCPPRSCRHCRRPPPWTRPTRQATTSSASGCTKTASPGGRHCHCARPLRSRATWPPSPPRLSARSGEK